MASSLYDKFREDCLGGVRDLSAVTVRAVLVDTGTYTFSAAHEDYDDLSGIVGSESPAFTTVSITGGVFNADDIIFTAVSGSSVEALVLFVDTGVAANDRLIVFIDSGDITGFPLTPSGGDIQVVWNASGIFKL